MCSVHPVLANLNNKSILALPLALLASTCMQALLARCCQGEMIHNLIPHAILPSSSSLTSFKHVLDQLLLPAVCISAVLVPVAMKTFSYPRSAKRWDAGGTARFCRALVQEDMDYVRKIVNIAPSLVNVNHPLGWAPLHVAALTGNVGIIRVLLRQRGVDVDVRDQSKFSWESLSGDIASRHAELSPRISGTSDTSGATPLHYACMAGSWDTIRALLDSGASPRTTDNRGRTPIQYFEEDVNRESLEHFEHYLSTFDRRLRTIKKTIHHSAATVDLRTFCEAICDNDYEFCEEALKSRPDLASDKDTKGWTALHVAVVKNNPSLVELILSYDKSALNTPDTYHFCDCGLTLCSPEYRKKFFQWGTLANSSGHHSTPLHYACMIGNWDIIEVLLKSGAETKRKNQDGQLPEDLIDKTLDGVVLQKYFAFNNTISLDCDSIPDLMSDDIDKDTLKDMFHGHSSDVICPVDFNSPPYSEKTQTSDNITKIADPTGWNNIWTPISDMELRNKYRKQKPMEDFLESKIIGQRGAILSVASAIRLRENGWSDPDRPLVFLFLGSSGVGKTELAKRIAQYVSYKPWLDGASVEEKTMSELERTNAFVRFDMSEYQQPHSVTNLIGSPKSYVGYDEGGSLTQKLKENPEAVVLLDEIEKAHEDLLTVFLQLFDDGRLTDSKYGTVYCPNAIFIMTSNLASDEIKAEAPFLRFGSSMSGRSNELDEYMQLAGKFTKKVHPVLKTALKRDEFLGRINQVVVLLPLKDDEIEIIIEQKLKEWRDRARDRHSIQLTWSPHVTKQLVKSHDVNFGVRSVLYEVEKMAVRLIAEAQIRGDIGQGWLAHLVVNRVRTIELRTLNPAASIREKNWCRYYS